GRVLHRQRTIETELTQKALAPRRVHSALARHILHRVARDEVNQGEREQRHAEKSRNDQRDATEDIGEQSVRASVECTRQSVRTSIMQTSIYANVNPYRRQSARAATQCSGCLP